MRINFLSSPWSSVQLLTAIIACVAVTGCESASQEAQPPANLGALKKAPEELARDRNTGGGGGHSYSSATYTSGSSRPSGGGGSSNPISSLRRAPTGVKPMGSSQPASRGGAKSQKGS